jgi:UDP-perosamine 4-acetyltransferase
LSRFLKTTKGCPLPEVLLLGAAGHAKVVIEIFRETSDYRVVGCLSPDAAGRSVTGVPVLGDDDQLETILRRGIVHAFAAIGDNRRRSILCDRLHDIGFRLVNAISTRAIVSPSVRLQEGIAIMPGAIINAESVIGAGAIINTGSTVDHDCNIGAYSHIAPGTNLAGEVTVGAGVFLGIGSRVIPKISIGEWSIVGAGGVVTANLPARVTAIGVPAKVIGITSAK